VLPELIRAKLSSSDLICLPATPVRLTLSMLMSLLLLVLPRRHQLSSVSQDQRSRLLGRSHENNPVNQVWDARYDLGAPLPPENDAAEEPIVSCVVSRASRGILETVSTTISHAMNSKDEDFRRSFNVRHVDHGLWRCSGAARLLVQSYTFPTGSSRISKNRQSTITFLGQIGQHQSFLNRATYCKHLSRQRVWHRYAIRSNRNTVGLMAAVEFVSRN
jgi:hypothetical protein